MTIRKNTNYNVMVNGALTVVKVICERRFKSKLTKRRCRYWKAHNLSTGRVVIIHDKFSFRSIAI